MQGEVERRATAPRDRLLAIFDVFDAWFRRDDFEGCSFINVLLEIDDQQDPVRQATVTHLGAIREFLRRLATEAGVSDPDDFARRWHILMKGSIVTAGEGDREAAKRARRMGELVLSQELAALTQARSTSRGSRSGVRGFGAEQARNNQVWASSSHCCGNAARGGSLALAGRRLGLDPNPTR